MCAKVRTDCPPPLLEFGSAKSPSTAFRDLYKKERDFAFNTFHPETHPEISSIPESAAEFLKLFEETREIQRILVHEAMTNIGVLHAQKFQVNSKKLYPHQRGHLFWSATTLAGGKESPSSALVRGAPGTGKTLEIGQWMQAGIHAQMRDLLPKGVIAYLTQRPFHLVQQTQGLGLARKRLVRTPPFTLHPKEIDSLYREYKKLCPKLAAIVKIKGWQELFNERPATEAEARSLIQRHLHHLGTLEQAKKIPDFEEQESKLIKLLLGNAAVVQDIDREPTLVDLPEINEETNIHTRFGGDAAFSIPAGYPVLAKERWGMQANEDVNIPKVLLMPAASLTSTVQREKLRAILKNIVLILVDEGGTLHPSVFENPVMEAKGKKPVVIAATATDQNRRWEARSPEHSVGESVEAGVLPDVGIDIFPSKDETHYPRDSMEAMQQLVDHHFKDLELLKRLKLPQPKEGSSLVVVHAKTTRECAKRLQDEYEKRKIPAEIFCFDGKTPQADREKLLLWMASAGDQAKILVGNPASLATALNLPGIHNVTIGTTINAMMLKQLLGRALHSAHHRVICRQQQFSNSNLSTTAFAQLHHQANIPENEEIQWIPGQALMSARAMKTDTKKARTSPAIAGITVPPPLKSPKKNANVITVGEGTEASEFLHATVRTAMDELVSQPNRVTLALLQEAFKEAGNMELAGIVLTYSGTLLLFIDQNKSNPDFRDALIKKIIGIREKARKRSNGNN